jgi:hypothetical protein
MICYKIFMIHRSLSIVPNDMLLLIHSKICHPLILLKDDKEGHKKFYIELYTLKNVKTLTLSFSFDSLAHTNLICP